MTGVNSTMTDTGKLILRVTLGLLVLLHGIHKLFAGVAGIESGLQAAGLPSILAYGVFIGEVVGPIMLIIGWYARVGAILIAINMLFALFLVHIPAGELFQLTPQGGWLLELQGMYLFTAIALALLGPGRFSVNTR
ncbi:MAG: DoxX family protein [Nitrococcus sp.]|nr:DoxX family protein [Nitrococcus sp.]